MDSAWISKFLLVAMIAALLTPVSASASNPASATVVLYNSNIPESRELALYYAARRKIPIAQIVGLDCPATEEITREVFNKKIAVPLRNQFVSAGWWQLSDEGSAQRIVTRTGIRFIAIMRGIPLKISHDRLIGPAKHLPGMAKAVLGRNDASVDSEIAALGLPEFTPAGLMMNPYFGRFTPVLEDSMPPGLLLPCRLDAPSADTVRRMIDDSIAAERNGLWGWAYVDARNIRDGAYAQGDQWMRNIVTLLRQRGMPVIFDQEPETLSADFPVTDAALYYGWYAPQVNGPFQDENFRFRPGAVAVHLHSFSAATLREKSAHWCAPLLERGAAATLGNVYEPYLVFTAHLDIFQERLMNNFTLAEAAYMAQRSISWAGVVIGDPLYRPFAAWDRFFEASAPPNPWREFRQITSRTAITDAVVPLHEAARETGDSLFLEALGAAQADSGHTAAALYSFRSALGYAKNPAVVQRLRMEIRAIENNPQHTPSPHSP